MYLLTSYINERQLHTVKMYQNSGSLQQQLSTVVNKSISTFQDHLLFIRTYSYEDNLLQPKPISFSTQYKDTCLQNYKLQHPLTKQCIKWLFQLSLSFNGRPIECNCKIKGAENANCNLIGGQCKCKSHVIGRTCSRCDFGFVRYPRCIKLDKRNF